MNSQQHLVQAPEQTLGAVSDLEQAHELNLTEVSERMAEALSERVPTVHPGMLIADAIEEVLRQQEPYMVQIRPEVSRRVRRRRDPFDVRLLLQRR